MSATAMPAPPARLSVHVPGRTTAAETKCATRSLLSLPVWRFDPHGPEKTLQHALQVMRG
eukprot:2852775-Prymnesium_polylepis.2